MPKDEITSLQIIDKLCKYVYAKDSTDRLRTRAILAHIYHHALHDNWFQARDLILMSHLQETIQHSDPSTQVNFNKINKIDDSAEGSHINVLLPLDTI